eukprot:2725219-Pleurochrysis_carterae.AAC.3
MRWAESMRCRGCIEKLHSLCTDSGTGRATTRYGIYAWRASDLRARVDSCCSPPRTLCHPRRCSARGSDRVRTSAQECCRRGVRA